MKPLIKTKSKSSIFLPSRIYILLALAFSLGTNDLLAQILVHNNNNVQIGPPSMPAPNQTLFVNGTAHFNCAPSPYGGFFIDTLNYIDTVGGQPVLWTGPIIKPNVSHNLDIGHDTLRLFRIYSNTVYAGAGGYQTYSDRNLKENIESINADSALHAILTLNGYTYNYKATAFPNTPDEILPILTSKAKLGLMADEIEPLIPEAVQRQPSGHYTIDYTTLIPLLVEAIKAQETRIAQLEALIKEE